MRILCALLAIGFALDAEAQKISPLFANEQPIQAVLSGPITTLYRQRKQDVRLYLDGAFSYKIGSEPAIRSGVKIRTRGNYRRLNCAHPPLLLNFKKTDNRDSLLVGQDKLKLVGPCKPNQAYQEYIGLEYLAYRIWQTVSPYHFKTRLLELSYIDTDKKRKPWTSTAFLIEDLSDVAKRVNRKRLRQVKVTRRQLDLAQTALLEVFQLFIGNSDYSTLAAPAGSDCCHNARLLVKKGEATGVIPVPYDFDVSGMVNAPYAKPAPQYPINSVRQRYFTGWCKEPARFQAAIDVFQQRKSEIYKLLNESQVINKKSKQKTILYADRFYDLINDPQRVAKEVIGRCRGSVING